MLTLEMAVNHWSWLAKLFSFNAVDGEVCHRDVGKCFDFIGQSKKYAKAKEDIRVYKGTRNDEIDNKAGYSVTTLVIPKGTRVHLGDNYHRYNTPDDSTSLDSKCRAEEAQVVQASDRKWQWTTYSFQGAYINGRYGRTPYRTGSRVTPNKFFDQESLTRCNDFDCYEDTDVTCEGGIHFFLRRDYAESYGSKNM